MLDLHHLLPQDKCDMERAEGLVALGYPAVAPVLPELMLWLQDRNWPVSDVISPFLASIGLPLVPHIRAVLDTDDEMWKIWVMQDLVLGHPEIYECVKDQIEKMAATPPTNEDEESVQETAQKVCDYFTSRKIHYDNTHHSFSQ